MVERGNVGWVYGRRFGSMRRTQETDTRQNAKYRWKRYQEKRPKRNIFETSDNHNILLNLFSAIISSLFFLLLKLLYVVKDSGVCLLLVHVCRNMDRVVGHPRPSLVGMGVPWVSLPDTPICLDAQVASKQSANPFVVFGVWSCQCLEVVFQRDFTALPLYAFRV